MTEKIEPPKLETLPFSFSALRRRRGPGMFAGSRAAVERWATSRIGGREMQPEARAAFPNGCSGGGGEMGSQPNRQAGNAARGVGGVS